MGKEKEGGDGGKRDGRVQITDIIPPPAGVFVWEHSAVPVARTHAGTHTHRVILKTPKNTSTLIKFLKQKQTCTPVTPPLNLNILEDVLFCFSFLFNTPSRTNRTQFKEVQRLETR